MSNVLVTSNFVRTLLNHNTNYTDIDGTSSVQIQYYIRRVDDDIVAYDGPDYVTMVTEGVIPNLGEEYLSWAGYASPPLTFMQCRSIEFEAGKNGACICNLTFSGNVAIKPSTLTGATPYAHLPAYCEYNASLRTTEIWRRGWTTTPPTAADATGDIGGFELASTKGGVPTEVPQVRIRLRFVRDADAASMLSQATTVTTYIGKINSQTFMGYPAGSVICEGMNMVHLNQEYYETVLDFLYDSFNHHSQVPDLNPDGTVKETASGEAEVVKWKRITRTSTDFNAIFGGNATLKAIVEKGYWD